MKRARAVAHSNIALVKYWGKRDGVDAELNLPAVGSLSMTLGELRTATEIASASEDAMWLDERLIEGPVAERSFAHLDRVWKAGPATGPRPPCEIRSRNYLPTAAGLASSASGFAALTLSAAGSFGLDDDREALAALARKGSGSAARSLWGGFVRLDAGTREDGSDCVARPLWGPEHWDVRLLVVHTAVGAKKVGSTGGMERSRTTSPYYAAWVESSSEDLEEGTTALGSRDLARLGAVMERSCFKMHACMLATVPPLMYWNGTTLDVIREVWEARSNNGLVGYVTSDAGPHVKVLCEAGTADALAARLGAVPGVRGLDVVIPGPDATVEVFE